MEIYYKTHREPWKEIKKDLVDLFVNRLIEYYSIEGTIRDTINDDHPSDLFFI